jgi:hypothetical protein
MLVSAPYRLLLFVLKRFHRVKRIWARWASFVSNWVGSFRKNVLCSRLLVWISFINSSLPDWSLWRRSITRDSIIWHISLTLTPGKSFNTFLCSIKKVLRFLHRLFLLLSCLFNFLSLLLNLLFLSLRCLYWLLQRFLLVVDLLIDQLIHLLFLSLLQLILKVFLFLLRFC